MAYTPKTWECNETITAEDLNHMEQGILLASVASSFSGFPIGSYYETSDVDFDPNTEWGGEWSVQEVKDVHVIEEGTSAFNWNYRKWSDGRAECSIRLTTNSMPPGTAVGGFYGKVLTAVGLVFPVDLFIEAPIAFVNLASWGTGYYWGSARAVDASSMQLELFRNDNASSVAVVGIKAEGYWKSFEEPNTIYRWYRTA